MKHYKPFQFKQFSVAQNNAAMKVGTDSVLLGSWAEIKPTELVLDIGTGTGILPIMLAQKVNGNCKIEAVEIDKSAITDAQVNFKNCPWKSSIHLIEIDFNVFNPSYGYDVIISNPPFFEGLAPTKKSRSIARNASDKLSYENLLQKAVQLLNPTGRIYLILPFEYFNKVINIAADHHLALQKTLELRPKKNKLVNRVLIELVHRKQLMQPVITKELTIRNEENAYTTEHKLLTKDYYLSRIIHAISFV